MCKTHTYRLLLTGWLAVVALGMLMGQGRPVNYLAESKAFVSALKNSENTDAFIKTLADAKIDQINAQLGTDNQKMAFWLNIYNGFIQVTLHKSPEKYKDRRTFFKEKTIEIGGIKWSFADIEHGILRRSQHEYFMGYLTRPFPNKFEKMLRVSKRDWRIHFALNCGAKSCPPVAAYDYETLDQQLTISTREYLSSHTVYLSDQNTAYVSPLFSWFRGDFGGLEGIRQILIGHNLIPDSKVRLKISEYDWTLFLGNFRDF
jgi:hypothetical protein